MVVYPLNPGELAPIGSATPGYDLTPVVYVPALWGYGEAPAPHTLVPGAMIVNSSIGIHMVVLTTRTQVVSYDRSQDYEYWEISFVGARYTEFAWHFRKSEWGNLSRNREETIGRKVVFDPSLLVFTEEQYKILGPTGKIKEAKPGAYHAERHDLYERWNLIAGKSYAVEYVYPEPYIKVEGVPLVMSAEPWRLDE